MKLLIAADIFPPEAGGPATYSVTLANELSKQGVEVMIVSLNPKSDHKTLDSKVKLFFVKNSFKPLRYWQYYKLLLKYGRDANVIYAMGPVNAGWPALKAARKLGKKFVVKVVGDYAWEQGQVLGLVKDSIDDFQVKKYGGKVGWLQRKEREVVKAADMVITPSRYLKMMVFKWGANLECIKKVYNAVSIPEVSATNKSKEELRIVTVARLTPWKGVRQIVEAVGSLVSDFPTLSFKVVGEGPELDSLKKLVLDKKLTNHVEFFGNRPRLETLRIIKSADLFILNSGYEGLSHAILEAQAYNIPVLASDVGGNPELVVSEWLFQLNNIEQIQDKIRHVLLEAAGESNVPVMYFNTNDGQKISFKEWTFELMVKETYALLSEVCAK